MFAGDTMQPTIRTALDSSTLEMPNFTKATWVGDERLSSDLPSEQRRATGQPRHRHDQALPAKFHDSHLPHPAGRTMLSSCGVSCK